MEVGNMITLQDNMSYGLLLETDLNNEKYFLAVQLNEKEEPTNVFKALKKIVKDNKEYVVEEKDPQILSSLLEDFSYQSEDVQ